MRKLIFSFFFTLAALASVPSPAQVSVSPLFSAADKAFWQARSVTGPYKNISDWCAYSPADWTTTIKWAEDFRLSPTKAGNTMAEDLNGYTGYSVDSIPGKNRGYPGWQFVKAERAAFLYFVSGDTAYGMPAKRLCLAEARRTGNLIDVRSWPSTVSYEAGTQEAPKYQRELFTANFVWNLFTPSEQAELVARHIGLATWFLNKFNNGPIGKSVPGWQTGNFSVRLLNAAPGGQPGYTKLNPAQDPVFGPPTTANRVYTGSNFVHRYRLADGTLSSPVSRNDLQLNNRRMCEAEYMTLAFLWTNQTAQANAGINLMKLWMVMSVYPDGTYGEYERDGDYGNASEGASFYGAMCIQAYIMVAHFTWRTRGDTSLYAYNTTDGAHGTQVVSGQPKSCKKVVYRYIDNMAGVNPLYWQSVSELNRISHRNLRSSRPTTCGPAYYESPYDCIFSVANIYYRDERIRAAYKRYLPGVGTYSGNMASAGMLWYCWGGTMAQYPGLLFMYGQRDQ